MVLFVTKLIDQNKSLRFLLCMSSFFTCKRSQVRSLSTVKLNKNRISLLLIQVRSKRVCLRKSGGSQVSDHLLTIRYVLFELKSITLISLRSRQNNISRMVCKKTEHLSQTSGPFSSSLAKRRPNPQSFTYLLFTFSSSFDT